MRKVRKSFTVLLQKVTDFKDDLAAQGLLQMNFKTLQGWRFPHTSGCLFQCLVTIIKKVFFLHPVWIILAVASSFVLFKTRYKHLQKTPPAATSSDLGRKGRNQVLSKWTQSRTILSPLPEPGISLLCKPTQADSLCPPAAEPWKQTPNLPQLRCPTEELWTTPPRRGSLSLGLLLITFYAVLLNITQVLLLISVGILAQLAACEPTSFQPRCLLISVLRKNYNRAKTISTWTACISLSFISAFSFPTQNAVKSLNSCCQSWCFLSMRQVRFCTPQAQFLFLTTPFTQK